jgi:hypothetical protein
MIALLTALAVSLSSPLDDGYFLRPPTVNISAVRGLECEGLEGSSRGSGFLIGNKVMATALHVVMGSTCKDADTGGDLKVYKIDLKHDLALVTSDRLPTNIPYIKYSCARFKTNDPYLAWGRTSYGMDDWNNVITRMNVINATAQYTPKGHTLNDGTPAEGMRVFDGFIAPGQSGAPITDLNGYARGLVNAGDNRRSIIYEFADGMLCK